MKKSGTWYILGLILIILGFIDLAFLTYSSHAENGIMVTLWGLACWIWGLRTDVSRRGSE